jgi:hypothetical protein
VRARVREAGLLALAAERREKSEGVRERGFHFTKTLKQLNSNKNLNSTTPKQCTSMYAIVNSYISLFN